MIKELMEVITKKKPTMWVKILRKPLEVILNEYISFVPNAIFMKQKTMGRQKEIYVNRADLNTLFDTMPKNVSKDIEKAVNTIKVMIKT